MPLWALLVWGLCVWLSPEDRLYAARSEGSPLRVGAAFEIPQEAILQANVTDWK